MAGMDAGGVEGSRAPALHAAPPVADGFRPVFQVRRTPGSVNREEATRRHRVLLDAWHDRRNVQKEWFSRTGLDVIDRRRTSLMTDKHRIERELMELMIGPDKTATDA